MRSMQGNHAERAQRSRDRRKAVNWARRRQEEVSDWEGIFVELTRALAPVYGNGRRLCGSEMKAVSSRMSGCLRGMGSVYLDEKASAGTRARPKSEERELLCLLPVVRFEAGEDWVSDLLSIRLHLGSRRASLRSEYVGLRYTVHVHERTLTRGICDEGAIEGEILRSLLDNAGMLALWRRAYSAGAIPHWIRPALPYRDGMILGAFQEMPERQCRQIQVDANGPRTVDARGNPLLAVNLGDRVQPAGFRASTAYDALRMNRERDSLRETLREFSERHGKVLMAIGEASLWNETMAASPLRTLERVDVQGATLDLVRIASNPQWRATLSVPEVMLAERMIGSRMPGETWEPEATLAMAM